MDLPIIVNIQTVLYTLPSWIVSIISLIPSSYLPLILLYTIITVFLVQRAQNKIKAVERKANQVPELEKEIAEWAGICDGLKYHLTPEVEKWEMQKKTGRMGSVTDYGMRVFNERKMLYDKADQKLRVYNDEGPKS